MAVPCHERFHQVAVSHDHMALVKRDGSVVKGRISKLLGYEAAG